MPQAVRVSMMESLALADVSHRLYETDAGIWAGSDRDHWQRLQSRYLSAGVMEEREQDQGLPLLCTSAFLNKKYNDRILLVSECFFIATVETMLRLWRAAQDFELRTRDGKNGFLTDAVYGYG